MVAVAAVPPPPAGAAPRDYASRLLRRINHFRSVHGRAPLHVRRSLLRAARAHSADMARHQYLGHLSWSGAGLERRLRYWGYRGPLMGEALAAGSFTPRATMRAWRRSPTHRRLLLRRRFRWVGLAVARGRLRGVAAVYVCADLGGR